MAAFATRNLVRLTAWRARREATDTVRGRTDQTFRGFIQVNLIRPR